MAKYHITYKDFTQLEPIVKTEILNGKDFDDAECNLFRKTKCERFTILTIDEVKGNFLNKFDA